MSNEADPATEDDAIQLTDEQADALALEQNIAVTAGAGTGKTFTLTERYLKMLEIGDVTPNNIVTITFTKDAANEMRERIRNAVDERLTAADTQTEYDEWRDIRDDLENGYLHTIHAFCSRLLTEHAVEAPIDSAFDTLDETDAAALQRDVVMQFIDENQGHRDLQLLARLWSRDHLETVLVGLLDSRPQSTEWAEYWAEQTPDEYLDTTWEKFIPTDGEEVDSWFAEPAFIEALEGIRALNDRDLEISDSDRAGTKIRELAVAIGASGALASDASTRDRQTAVNDIAAILTTGGGTRYSSDTYYYGTDTNGWSDLKEDRALLTKSMDTLLETIKPEDIPTIDDLSTERNSSYYVLALARIYAEVEQAYRDAKTKQSALDYSDLIETTIEFLTDHPDARAAVRDQFEFVMIDEVQDTDPRQWRLVQALTGTDPQAFDSQNVFLVGDEKQSIYRFRGADVTAFSDAQEGLAAANPAGTPASLPLSGNFRTVEPTLEFINDLFDEVFEPEADERAPFEAEPQCLSALRNEGTEVPGQCEYLLTPKTGGEGLLPASHTLEQDQFMNAAHREATALAARLSHLFADPPEVYDEDDKEYRPAAPDDVTILLRARTRLEFYERALDDLDIPYTVVSGQGFYDTPEITALVNLIRLLEDPTNDIALYGVLRSPLFGITDEELARTFSEEDSADRDSLWSMLPAATGTPQKAATLIRDWRHALGLEPNVPPRISTWSSLLTRVIDDTGYLASVSADDRPQQAVVNVEKFREQLRDWEDNSVLTASGLLARIDRQKDLAIKTPEATIHTGKDGVELRTVHSAKGLESRIVVVPELDVSFNHRANVDEYGKVYLHEVDGVPFLGLKAPTQTDTYVKKNTLVRNRLKAFAEREERAEQKRLLYVAMTRARDHLILSGTNKLTVEDGEVSPHWSNPSSARQWRDYVESVLFEDVELETLLGEEVVTGELANSEYRIRLPPAPTPYNETGTAAPTTPPTIDTPTPDRRPQPRRLSATDYGKFVNGEYNGDSDRIASNDSERADGEFADDSDNPATVFGDAVHHICELERPESEWPDIIESVIADSDVDADRIDTADVFEHARRGLAGVEALHADLSEPLSYSELFVRANVDSGEVVGFIDHLAVTDDAYYLLDFKTSDTSIKSTAEHAERYWPQLKAYAVALNQQAPREVHALLYFTDTGDLEKRVFGADDIPAIETSLDEALRAMDA